ncbi:COG1361 S-layer family protein [Anaerotignum sp.]|uniref:COG1361 S-layer family protein n=1 Tax=Anaerotignum sp. TaxID=2039241 RepID=UPI002714C714|nr:CARDB domain-containing protein [Anaerotignum sp.]
MMGKRLFQRVFTAVMILSMVLGQTAVALADDISDSGSPRIIVAGDTVAEVEAGKENRFTFQVKNKGASAADSVYINAKKNATDPFRVSIKGGGDVGSIGANGYTNVTLIVNVNGEVKESSYPVTLDITYTNANGSAFSSSETVYLKMEGFDDEPSFKLDSMKLSPESMSPGSSANLNGKILNNGEQEMLDVDISLSNLETDKISLSSGFSSKHYASIPAGGSADFAFSLVASADMAAGNYPVNIKLNFKDEFGKSVEKEMAYYVNVGGIAGQKSQLEIRNMKEPSGVYDVNQNFTISFDLYNSGKIAAKNIVVTAEAVDSSAVVPKSASVKTISELAPGATTTLSYTFAGTAASKSQNYAIQFTTEYTSGGTAVSSFKQFAGVNVSNPDSDEENSSKPKLIVSNYACDPLIVMAGHEFDLNMEILNTHASKGVKNIKMFLTLAEETSSESEKSGNIFTPVKSSNTFYFDAIGPKSTAQKQLRLYVVPEAQPKTYTLTVNFEYEDSAGKEYTATELLGINVKQVTELQVDDFAMPDTVEMYSPVTVSFGYYNTGKVTLSNVMVKLEGDVDCQNKNTYIGNMDSGAGEYYETSFTPNNSGEVPVSIVISYEDATGEVKEDRRDFVLNVMEPMMPEDMEDMDATPPMDMKKVMISIALLALIGMGLFVFVRRQKQDPPSNFAESVDDLDEDDDEDDDDREDMSL